MAVFMTARSFSAVQAHGLPAPKGSLQGPYTVVPPGHRAPVTHVRSVKEHSGT